MALAWSPAEPRPCAGTRAAIEEQLRLGQELRQRANQAGQAAAGKPDGGSSTDASDPAGSGSDEEEGSAPSGRRRRQSDTRAAALDILQGGPPPVGGSACGVVSCVWLPAVHLWQELHPDELGASCLLKGRIFVLINVHVWQSLLVQPAQQQKAGGGDRACH